MRAFAGLFLAVILSVPMWGDTRGANTALPGTLNYVEGQASMGAETLNSKSIGSAELQKGQTLSAIAYQYYGDAGQWRPIADANNLANPRLLTPGMTLQVPSLTPGQS